MQSLRRRVWATRFFENSVPDAFDAHFFNGLLVVLVKLPHPNPATAAHVLKAFSDKLNAIASPMRQSLTYDRGREMAEHARLHPEHGYEGVLL